MKSGIRKILTATAIVVAFALAFVGCVDNGVVAPNGASIVLSANPQTVVIDPNTQTPDPQTGRFTGETQIDALLLDENGFLLEGVSIVFRTTAGTLASGGNAIETNENGVASDTLTVTDLSPQQVTVTALSGNLAVTTQVTVQVVGDNILPSASIFASPATQQRIGQLATFNGSTSTDPDGTITCFQWSITSDNPDPGTPNPQILQGQTLAVIQDTYENEQNLTVTLKVSDDAAAAGICNESDPPVPGNLFSPLVDSLNYRIICDNSAPTAVINGPSNVSISINPVSGIAPIILDGRPSFDDDTPSTLMTYLWTCPGAQTGPIDQAFPPEAPNSVVQCNYNVPGNYAATLTVTDRGTGVFDPISGTYECQLSSSPDTINITVNAAP